MILALDLDPALANKPAQYHLACRNWEAVGKLPVGQAQMLHDGSVGHVWAFGRTSDGHLPFAFEISGEGKARGYDEANGETGSCLTPRSVTPVVFRAFSAESGNNGNDEPARYLE
jgi:hypothetical protein